MRYPRSPSSIYQEGDGGEAEVQKVDGRKRGQCRAHLERQHLHPLSGRLRQPLEDEERHDGDLTGHK